MKCVIDDLFKRNIDYYVRDMAHFCGISSQALYSILNNKSKPNVYIALKICMFLNQIPRNNLKPPFMNYLNVSDLFVFDQLNF